MMRGAGLNTYRVLVFWPSVQPSSGTRFNWTPVDAAVGNAASQGMTTLPFLTGSPPWLTGCANPLDQCQKRPPVASAAQRSAWSRFLSAAVARYGPGGEFWAENPRLPPRPIEKWQIWNEENLPNFAGNHRRVRRAGPELYARLLRVSAHAIRLEDPNAKIVVGGLSPGPHYAGRPVRFLRGLYQIPGARRNFDVVAMHPYFPTAHDVARLMKRTVQVMRQYHDASPLWVTEIGWSSSLADGSGSDLRRGPAGQQQLVKKSFKLFARNRASWNLRRVYYFSWRDVPDGNPSSWVTTAGLHNVDLSPKPAWTALTELIKRYR